MISGDDGALWFCELSAGKLGRVDPGSGAITEYTPMEQGVQPRRLAAANGAIYFTDFNGGRLGRLTLADKKFKFWESPSGSHSEPYGIAADSAGKIWYEESPQNANNLVRFDPTIEAFRTYTRSPAPNSSVGILQIWRGNDRKGRLWLPLTVAINKIAVLSSRFILVTVYV